MRPDVFLLFVLTFFSSLLHAQTTLTFEVENAANDSCMIAYYYGDKQYIIGDEGVNQMLYLDKKGKGTFVRDDMEKGVYLIVFPPENNYVEFLFEGSDASFQFDKENAVETMRVENAPGTALMYDDLRNNRRVQQHYPNAEENKEQRSAMLEAQKTFRENLKKEHPNNFYVELLQLNAEPEIPETLSGNGQYARYYYYKEHYFDNVAFDQSWILRTPTYHSKLMTYMDRLTSAHPDSIKASVDEILQRADQDPEVFKYTVIALFNKYATSKMMGHDGIYVHIANNYYLNGKADWVDEEQFNKIRVRVSELQRSLIGEPAPDIFYLLDEGVGQYLTDVMQGYTIVLFAKPNCGHCKNLIDELMALEGQLPENTQVIMVHFDITIQEVKKATEENGYWWKNVALDDDGWLAKTFYDIKTFPKLFLLEEKTIVGKQITMEQAIALIESRQAE